MVLDSISIDVHHWLLANTQGRCVYLQTHILLPQTGLLGVKHYIFPVLL